MHIEPTYLRRFLATFIVAVGTCVSSDFAKADLINWDAPVAITGDSDVSTLGTLVGAGNLADADSISINGISFSGISFTNGSTTVTSGIFEFSVAADGLLGVDDTFTSAGNPFSNLSTEYQDLLDSGMFTWAPPNDPAPITLKIGSLSVGQMYQFQWWVNDPRGTGDFDRTTTATAGNGVSLEHNLGNAEGGVGQYVIGTFTADATTQQIIFQGAGTGPNVGSTQINAFQLRAIPEPTSAALLVVVSMHVFCLRRRRFIC